MFQIDEGIEPSFPGRDSVRVPKYGDLLVHRATPDGFKAYADADADADDTPRRSFFIKSFCEVIFCEVIFSSEPQVLDSTVGQGDFSTDLVTLLTRVNASVAAKMTYPDPKTGLPAEVKQIPEITSRLTKAIYFNKPIRD